jgi:hypothetical protein
MWCRTPLPAHLWRRAEEDIEADEDDAEEDWQPGTDETDEATRPARRSVGLYPDVDDPDLLERAEEETRRLPLRLPFTAPLDDPAADTSDDSRPDARECPACGRQTRRGWATCPWCGSALPG